jgi:hypothetical protein
MVDWDMKTNQEPENDPALSNMLHQWVVDTPLPSRFQDQVWQRIARAETQPQAGLWAGLQRWVNEILPRPGFAVAYLSLVLALGAGAGSLASQARNNRLNSELGTLYVQSVDPYRAEGSRP